MTGDRPPRGGAPPAGSGPWGPLRHDPWGERVLPALALLLSVIAHVGPFLGAHA